MKTLNYLILGTALLGSAQAFADNKWNDKNNPKNYSPSYTYNFYSLPTEGGTGDSAKGWSDSYWPTKRGSILDRYQQPNLAYQFSKYVFPSANQVATMSSAQLNLYSPSEKFDIIRGLFDYPLSSELKKIDTKKEEYWKGLCNGWTRASLGLNEPQSIMFRSPITGQVVPLTSADIKALLAYYYSNIDDEDTVYIGSSVRGLGQWFGSSKGDPNPGAFHVAVANEMGLLHQGMSMDRDPGKEVWNQPFTKFSTKVVSETRDLSHGHSKEAVKEVRVLTTMTFANELYNTTDEDLEDDKHVAPSVDALGAAQHMKTVTYDYTLELDRNDNIIGGVWNTADHPDLMWKQKFDLERMATDSAPKPGYVPMPKLDWTVLREIVRQSTGQ